MVPLPLLESYSCLWLQNIPQLFILQFFCTKGEYHDDQSIGGYKRFIHNKERNQNERGIAWKNSHRFFSQKE